MKPKKDVLFLCQFFHPEYISSAQLPFDTAKALQKSGLTVDVLCGYPREYYSGPPVPDEEVTLELQNGLSPIVFTPCDKSKPTFAYMVLPVRLRSNS